MSLSVVWIVFFINLSVSDKLFIAQIKEYLESYSDLPTNN